MLSLSSIKPLNRWDYSSIQPGPVGSVGDVLMSQRLKSSLPGDFRWEEEYYGENESLYGSSVSDGQYKSYNSGGGTARTFDNFWGGRRDFSTCHGFIHEDIRAPDKRVEPYVGSLPQYSWRNKIATVNKAFHTGDLFTIPVRGLVEQPDGVTRGSQFPRVTDVVGNLDPINNATDLVAPNYKPQLSSFSDQNPIRQTRDMNSNMRGGTLGRLNR